MTHREAAGVDGETTLRGRRLPAARVLNELSWSASLEVTTKTTDG